MLVVFHRATGQAVQHDGPKLSREGSFCLTGAQVVDGWLGEARTPQITPAAGCHTVEGYF